MEKKIQRAISPTRSENYPEWYQEVIKAADLAENSSVRGCMVIKPWGYAIWENIQRVLDGMFKATGHVNAYFPLLIPLSYLEKEAAHVEGFAKECAVVTHHRLQANSEGKLMPAGVLDEPFIIRPTSETIIGHSFSKWVQSYRDLPLLINQWANVMRWEMRTRLFLRTSEFLWQEGHTAHATKEEAIAETLQMLGVYRTFAYDWLATPVITGQKTSDERFPGAVDTYTVEALMQDKKALQGGTSHFLGQNFAKASEIIFLDKNGNKEYAWTTSWGSTTRMIGSLIMTHSDDDGLVLPPKLAPKHLILLPIYRNDEERNLVLEKCRKVKAEVEEFMYHGTKLVVDIDDRDIRGGEKLWSHIKKGVPLYCEIGPRDIQANAVMYGRRDSDNPKNKFPATFAEFIAKVPSLLDEIQANLLQRALKFRKENTVRINSLKELESFFPDETESKSFQGGFAWVPWNEKAIGHPIYSKLKISNRCIPQICEGDGLGMEEHEKCIFTGLPSTKRILIAKAY